MDLALTSPHRVSHTRMAGLLLFGVSGLILVPCPALAGNQHRPHRESKRSDTREIEALEAVWRGAIVKGDVATLDTLLADDFFGISSTGTISDKRQYLDRIAAHHSEVSSLETIDLKVRMQPTIAIAVSQARLTGALAGRPTNGVFRYTRVYGRVAGKWRVLNFEATRVSGGDDDSSEMVRGLPLAPDAPVPPSR